MLFCFSRDSLTFIYLRALLRSDHDDVDGVDLALDDISRTEKMVHGSLGSIHISLTLV